MFNCILKKKQGVGCLFLLICFAGIVHSEPQQAKNLKAASDRSEKSMRDDLAAWWPFDKTTVDQISGIKDSILGNYKFMSQGVKGECLMFDGFTTLVQRPAEKSPRFSNALTFSGWIAIGAYPWNWSPVVSQRKDRSRGFDFGLDYKGRFGLQLAVGDQWIQCISQRQLDMRKWYHLAAAYHPESGITLYLNGKEAGRCEAAGEIRFAPEVDLNIGRNHETMLPVDRVREWAKFPSWWAHDGMLDEIKIYNRALSPSDIRAVYLDGKTDKVPDIPMRKFPDVSAGLDRFGAYATNLNYYEQWDALWQMAGKPDVVIKFDEMPVSMVFWKGTHFSPCWVTENGKWMADQSLETGVWPKAFTGQDYQGAVGCSEHMSDTECRFTFAKIVENNDARVVVHWRYAMVDCNLRFVKYDDVAGQGQWGDEFYYIYPDAVATRYVVGWWPKRQEHAHQETIFLSEPGTKPEDNCRLDAVTLVGLEGESKTYSWKDGYPSFDVHNPVIQMVNLKSDYKPYMILNTNSRVRVFGGEARKGYSHFPWWNHWPVSRVHSDGRYAEFADRAAHSSLSQTSSSNGLYLYGMTNKVAKKKLSLAKSWISPPKLEVFSPGCKSKGYDQRQRAYIVENTGDDNTLKLKLLGSRQSPVHNPAFVIKDWGENSAELCLNGKVVPWGKSARVGHRYTIKRCDLIVWLKLDSIRETNLILTRQESDNRE